MSRALGNPNYQGPFGNTLLHGAVASGDLAEVRLLLAAGADPLIVNREGQSALEIAAFLRYTAIYDLLALTSRRPAPGSAPRSRLRAGP